MLSIKVYLGKKRKYITLVLDLRTGRVIHIGRGKGKNVFKGFWMCLKRPKAKGRVLATAYYMKERLWLLFQHEDRDRAQAELTAGFVKPIPAGPEYSSRLLAGYASGNRSFSTGT